jgi:putative DNA primase/helicase
VTYAPGWHERIPQSLRERPQWVVWRYEWRTKGDGSGKWTKVPYIPREIRGRWRGAKANDPSTWGTFEEALRTFKANCDDLDGIGFVFSPDDPFVGIDFDRCLTEDGTILPWAAEWLKRLGPTYVEVSPSVRGLKAFYRGSLPVKSDGSTGRRRAGYGPDGSGEIEAYDRTRFFTVTGQIWEGERNRELYEARPDALVALAAELDAPRPSKARKSPRVLQFDDLAGADPASLSDEQLLAKARRAKNGLKFAALYDMGDVSEYPSDSEADAGLMTMLAFRTGNDAARMERLFSASALGQREKWTDRPDYRQRTIDNAIKFNGPNSPTKFGWAPSSNSTGNAPNHDGKGKEALDQYLAGRPQTDLGNAERTVARYGADLRYCHPWKKWFVWDGRRWHLDDRGDALARVCQTVRTIVAEAMTVTDNKELRDALLKWAHDSENHQRIVAALDLAKSQPGIPILHDEMNADRWSFNCLNGTIDLRTGELQPHRREDRITQLCPFEYHPDATCPLWDATLEKFFHREDPAKQAELIAYWQRICGCALAGAVRDHILPIAYGDGSNGKSTILGTLLNVFGPDYAMKAQHDLLISKKQESHPTATARLYGKRLVAVIETDMGHRLNESLIKELTGGDKICTRRMREDFWEFTPSHTLIMATNYKPHVRGTDRAIWRRLVLIPFIVTVTEGEAIKDMPDRLMGEVEGILAWCVRGCLDWQRHGLTPPSEVLQATRDYRVEQDVFGAFLDECTERDPNFKQKATPLFQRYKQWAESNNEYAMSQKVFGQAMAVHGLERMTNNGTWYMGIRLKLAEREDSVFHQETYTHGALIETTREIMDF